MKRKKFIKLAMAAGYSRNEASDMADRCTGMPRLIAACGMRVNMGIAKGMRQALAITANCMSIPYVYDHITFEKLIAKKSGDYMRRVNERM